MYELWQMIAVAFVGVGIGAVLMQGLTTRLLTKYEKLTDDALAQSRDLITQNLRLNDKCRDLRQMLEEERYHD